jgi:hypothetical protein
MIWFWLSVAAGLVVGWFISILIKAPRLRHPLACEYWVYLPTEKGPTPDALMTRMVRDNPLTVNGAPAIGHHEGLVFSDIRLHIALVLRSRNAHVFRPDLFEQHIEPSAEILTALGESQAIHKLRFLSEEPMSDDAYLQFLPHLALSSAELSGAKVIFDTVGERLFTTEWLREELTKDANAKRADLHVRAIWKGGAGGGVAETRGLLKIGLPEMATVPGDADQRVLLTTVMEEAARLVWQMKSLPLRLFVEAYQDMFELHVLPTRKGPYQVRVFRLPPALSGYS